MRFYGSIDNRLLENRYFFNETNESITEGMPCTIYYWSDRHAYEVVKVFDQTHVSVRKLRAIRTDGGGMSEFQQYRYERDLSAPVLELKLKNGKWRQVLHYDPEYWAREAEVIVKGCSAIPAEQAYAEFKKALTRGKGPNFLTEKQFEKLFDRKEEVIKLGEMFNISFGIADEYYDFSF